MHQLRSDMMDDLPCIPVEIGEKEFDADQRDEGDDPAADRVHRRAVQLR